MIFPHSCVTHAVPGWAPGWYCGPVLVWLNCSTRATAPAAQVLLGVLLKMCSSAAGVQLTTYYNIRLYYEITYSWVRYPIPRPGLALLGSLEKLSLSASNIVPGPSRVPKGLRQH